MPRGQPSRKRTRKQPPTSPLSREKILEVSERLVNEVGIERFSMRQLARELGATPMSLYWHFDNKADVLNELVGLMFARIELPKRSKKNWRAATVELLTNLRQQFLEHATVVHAMGTSFPTKEAYTWANAVVELMLEAGLSEKDSVHAFNLLLRYTVSTSAFVVGIPSASPEMTREERRAIVEETVKDLPEASIATWRRVRRHFRHDRKSQDAEFRFGLERILDGIEQYADAG